MQGSFDKLDSAGIYWIYFPQVNAVKNFFYWTLPLSKGDKCEQCCSVHLAKLLPWPVITSNMITEKAQLLHQLFIIIFLTKNLKQQKGKHYKTHVTHTWMSLAGFQSISKSISLEAPIKFKPTPPALELNRKTTTNRPLYANLIVCKRCNMFFFKSLLGLKKQFFELIIF